MLYSSFIFAAALAGFAAAAQNDTVIACCSVPVDDVPLSTRQSWCNAQENTCVELCGGQGDIASNGNDCTASTLDYSCTCSNGTTIADSVMKEYQQTVPSQMCYYWYDACINATIGSDGEGNASEQYQCTQSRDSQCGNITIDQTDSSSSSASGAASTATGGGSRTSSGASVTGASSTASSEPAASSGAAVALGTPVLAAGLLAIFGLAL